MFVFTIEFSVPQGNLLEENILILQWIQYDKNYNSWRCHINGAFAAAIVYTDNLVLLSPSLIGMQHMLDM